MEELPTTIESRPALRVRTLQGTLRRAKFGIIAAFGISFLSFYPQLQLWMARGGAPSEAVAYNQGLGDEVAYASYLNAIIEGRPRRSDPYTGRDHTSQTPQPESLFSIQFLPAYAVALPARALGISASTVFIILTPFVAFSSSLILFCFFQVVTRNEHLAAVGVVIVFCLGALAAGEGAIANWTTGNAHFDFLPFLRRYQPSTSFPFFLLLLLLTWQALRVQKASALILSAFVGAILSVLIFSYFYLWTAAAAWLLILGIIWWVLRPADRGRLLRFLGIVGAVSLAALVPYVYLILGGSETMPSVSALVLSRKPDLFSVAGLIAGVLIIVLVIAAVKGKIDRKDGRVIFAASLAVLPFVVLNQQVITGRVMQPIHYKGFVTNYSLLIAIVLTAGLVWTRRNGETWKLSKRALFWMALAAFEWGFIETRHASLRGFVANDKAADELSVYARLEQVAANRQPNDQEVVLFSDLRMADGSPVVSRVPVMWAPHMVVYSGASLVESKERLYRHLYYTGVGPTDLEDYLFGRKMYYGCAVGLFGFDRFIDGLNPNAKPISLEEKMEELSSYEQYTASFDSHRAAHPRLRYLVTPADETPDFSNVDRWYRRDHVEQVGKFLLYRVTLKEDESLARDTPPDLSRSDPK